MNKQQLLAPYGADDDLRLLLARLLDRAALCEARSIPTASVFLTAEQQEEAMRLLRRAGAPRYALIGGYASAERKLCAFLPDWMEAESLEVEEQSPLCALDIQVPPTAALRHPDYLGALMGLGISREKFGDILLTDTGAQLVLLRETLPLLEDQFESVGRYSIKLQRLPLIALSPSEASVRTIRSTVASLRMDAVLAGGFSISRGRAAELIEKGAVQRNHKICQKPDAPVAEGDVFTARGFGKFLLRKLGGQSKKGRLQLEIDRYE